MGYFLAQYKDKMTERRSKNHYADDRKVSSLPQAELVRALTAARKRISKLEISERGLKESRSELEKLTFQLGERVKELNCLYAISNVVELRGVSIEEILQETVDLIPRAWQYPDITCCRITIHHRAFTTSPFRETPWKQSQHIVVQGSVIGSLDVYYLEEKPFHDEGPFLKEERSLIKVIAERIGEIIERKEAEKALRKSEAQNRALLSAIPDLMFQIDQNGILLGVHGGKVFEPETVLRGMIGKNVFRILDEQKVLPKKMLEQGIAHVRRAFATGRTQVFEQHISLDGEERDYEVRIVVSRKDEALGIVRDMTVRKRLEKEIIEISGREQRRIGQDLHDSLCQHLAGIGFLAKVLEKKITEHLSVKRTEAAEIVDLIDQAITLTRGFAKGLFPVRLEAEGFMHALSELAFNAEKLFGIRCRVAFQEPLLIHDHAFATHLYRIAQEALNNAIKHGKAATVDITLSSGERGHTLTVSDDGIGFQNAPRPAKGMGLSIMNYRATMIGASVEIKNGEKGGTMVICSFQNRSFN